MTTIMPVWVLRDRAAPRYHDYVRTSNLCWWLP